jgi:hypothetical protein
MPATVEQQKVINSLVVNDMGVLPPKFRTVAGKFIIACNKDGLDIVPHETRRTQELQDIYFQIGASHAKDILHSWHGYDLAIDFKSKSKEWAVPDEYWQKVAKIANDHGLVSGIDFTTIKGGDPDHIQWMSLRGPWVSPTKNMQSLLALGKKNQVWEIVGAI